MNTIIEHNLMFSPQARALHTAAGAPEQEQHGGQGTRTNKRAWSRSLPLMFIGMIAVLAVLTRSDRNFNVNPYDCSAPSL